MGAGHTHALHHHGHTRVHRLAPEAKVAATVAFVVAVAVTPRTAVWAFGIHAGLVLAVIAAARLPLRFVVTRLAVVVPFVLFAFTLPFVATGERIDVAGLELSREGLWGMFNVLAKAGLGATASIVLAGTTEQTRILTGLERLRVPGVLTSIAAFMLRYLEVIAGELSRTRTAMTARGYDPRWLWQVKPIASSAGALFVRSYERGERVHAAMLGRGFTGTMPALDERRATAAEWSAAAVVPVAALAVTAAALIGTA